MCCFYLIGLSLVAGISVVQTIKSIQSIDDNSIGLKWPNDVLIDNKKVAGILAESFGEANGSSKLIIGFGLNIHNN